MDVLFASAGQHCITVLNAHCSAECLSAHQACRSGFHKIHIATDLAIREGLDANGFYKRVSADTSGESVMVSSKLLVDSGDSRPVCNVFGLLNSQQALQHIAHHNHAGAA